MVLLSDPSKAETLLGWRPKSSVEVGISETARWLETRLDKYNIEQYHV